jgi:uncharacterized membrane protein
MENGMRPNMKENLKSILFIASIALNVFFVATYVVYKVPSLAGGHSTSVSTEPFLQLHLSSSQLKRFRVKRNRFHAQLNVLEGTIKAKELHLIDLLSTAPTDHQAIQSTREDIRSLQKTVQDNVIKHLLQGSTLFTPKQRTLFFRLIKERIEAGPQGCPVWEGSPGSAQPDR